MRVQALSLATLSLLEMAMVSSSARALTREEIVAKLESAGYSQIRQVPAGKINRSRRSENGKEVSIIVDSSGHIKELQ
jgi:hypothetical protein